ncbi:MAG: ABC transporter permease [bacterium]|nr:ABC transporter permease [bacterium]
MFTTRVRQLVYLLRQGIADVRAAGISASFAVVSVACSLLLLCLYFMVLGNLSKALDSALDLKVILYLRENLSQEQIGRLQKVLEGTAEIVNVRFISQAAALEEFRASLGKEAYLLDALDSNPLPASFELSLNPKVKEPNQLKPLLEYLAKRPEVESVQGGVEWVERLSNLLVAGRLILLLLGVILTIISLVIIATTIHLTVDRRRDEISIMRLVGASEWYIRLPFIFEGMLEGLLGGLLAIGLSAGLYYAFCWKVSPLIKLIFGAWSIDFLRLEKALLILVLGSAVGGAGALVSLSCRSAK